jgi:hypothetical protein
MRVGNWNKRWLWIRRNVAFAIVVVLISGSLLGTLQSLLWPTAVGMRWNSGKWRLDVDVRTDHMNLSFRIHCESSQHYSEELRLTFRRMRNDKFFHPGQLLPAMSIFHPDPVVPDVHIRLRIPYMLMLLLGLTTEWLRRRIRNKHCVGFTVPGGNERGRESKGLKGRLKGT